VGVFVDQQLERVLAGMTVPEELERLFEWIELQGYASPGRRRPDEPYGSLHDQTRGHYGTRLEVHADQPAEAESSVRAWLDEQHAALFLEHVWPFARSFDGSRVALWRDPHDVTRVVHLGSGSGSMLTCVLGKRPVDFLRLIAIGYDEVCWPEYWDLPPVGPINEPLRDWVESTFGVTVPATALEVVPYPAEMSDEDSDDPFLSWLVAVGVFGQ
jgi:hypothetical protein